MKRKLIYTLVGLLAMSVSGSATYALQNTMNSSEGNKLNEVSSSSSATSSHVWGPSDFDNNSTTVSTGFDGMMNKLMATKRVDIPSLSVKLKMASMGDYLTVNILDGKFDGTDLEASKLTAHLEVKYQSIDVDVTVNYESGDYAYFSYVDTHGDTKKYSLSAKGDISGIINMLPKIGIKTPSLPALDDINLTELLAPISNALQNPVETKVEGGYLYTVDFGSISVKTITVSGLKLVFGCDEDYNLNSIAVADDGSISIVDSAKSIESISVGLKGQLKTADTTSYTNVDGSSYQDISNIYKTADTLCETIGQIADAKAFKSNMQFTLTSDDASYTTTTIDGSLKGNFENVSDKTELSNGKYEMDFVNSGINNDGSELYAFYDGANAYFKANDIIKGKMSLDSIKDVVNQAQEMTKYVTLPSNELTDDVNSIMTLIKGGAKSIPSDLVSDFTYSDTNFNFKINANSLGLGDYMITVGVNTEKDGTFSSVEIQNITYKTFHVGFKLNLQVGTSDFKELKAEEYKDYSGAAGIFDTVEDIAQTKQASASYELSATTSIGKKYKASGSIDADASKFVKDDKTNADYYGDYHLTLKEDDISANASHSLEAYYQDQNAYVNYSEVGLKNSVSTTSVGKIMDFVKKYSTANPEDLNAASQLINELKSSSTLKADLTSLKEGRLSTLKSFISIDSGNTDANKIILDINLPYIFQDTSIKDKVSGVKIELDMTTKALEKIVITDLTYDNNIITSFALTLKNYAAFRLTSEQAALYVSMDGAVDSFVNLPNQLTKFELGLSASLTDEGKTTSMDGFANVDRTDAKAPAAGGDVKVIESDSTTHDLKFKYQTETSTDSEGQTKYDGLTNVQYNDHMHIIVHNSSVLSIIDDVKKMPSTNMLYKYVNGTDSLVNGLPLLKVVKDKDYLSLLNGYVRTVQVTSNQIILGVNPACFESSIALNNTLASDTLVVTYDASNSSITKAELNAIYSGKTISVTIDMAGYLAKADPSDILEYNDTNKDKFINMDNLPLFVQFGLNTTEHSYFCLYGNFVMNLNLSNTSWTLGDIKTFVTAKIKISDGKTKAYLCLNNTSSKKITDSGFYCTEYFIQEDGSTYVCQTRNTKGGNNYYSTIFHITRDEIIKNIVYYVVDFSLDVYDMTAIGIPAGKIALEKIYEAMNATASTDATISKDYSRYVNSATYSSTNKSFDLDVALNNIITYSGIAFQNILLSIGHSNVTKMNTQLPNEELTSLYLRGGDSSTVLTAYGIADVNVSLQAYRDVTYSSNGAEICDMSRYDNFMAAMGSQSSTLALADKYYQINSISPSYRTFLGIPVISSYTRTVNSNGNYVSMSYGADSRYFYQA
jgi:hypothetical protein